MGYRNKQRIHKSEKILSGPVVEAGRVWRETDNRTLLGS